MHGPDHAYHGLAVSTWDVWRDDTAAWPDRSLFLDAIHRSGEPVLDLLCASGRLLLDYLGEGIDVEGLDGSAEMLSLVRRKAAERGLPERAPLRGRTQGRDHRLRAPATFPGRSLVHP